MVSGPSGAGKTSLCAEVLTRYPWLRAAVSHTTRPPRPGEEEGKDYFFVSTAEFRMGIEAGRFAEWAEVHGHLYGTSEDFFQSQTSLGKDVILDIDTQGALQLKSKHPEAILIFLVPPSLEELERRLRGRKTESDDAVERRLGVAKREMELSDAYNHIIVNSDIEGAAKDVEIVIDRERGCRQPP